MDKLRLLPPQGGADPKWLSLRNALWPETPPEAHLAGMADSLRRGHFVRLAHDPDGQVTGFVEASLRHDYVNGTDSSPVGFLEGLYVTPAARRRGVARAMVAAVRQWAIGEGARELASDAMLDNPSAHAVHRALGFAETERVVYFRMSLG